jgi:glyceraldehyde 3-phosphate dehydrogenase
LNVDIVFECTGAFTKRKDLDAHIRAGAGYVILSAPSKSDDVETIVHGVNTPQAGTVIISCASCTTNCITPVMEVLGRRIGVKKAIMTTIHEGDELVRQRMGIFESVGPRGVADRESDGSERIMREP